MTPEQLADRLEAAATRVGPAIQRAVQHTGELGRARIRGNASGRPGPNVIRPDGKNYRSSWKAQNRSLPHGALCTIGTNAPQGRRLEFGFMGMTDSLGRTYHQPPFPHVGPAIDYIGETFMAEMRFAVAEVLR
ncbi:HK97 gp10 family phage protein [Streptomyces sp. NBC_01221]|uniref:HK97 gp10 family phage protein n=1 Tax=Streptomyces sp. NBC_01221 TaxID=2903782 RepID=UPI00225105FA|nr:HK97 gp10 family phage protein [Streptomyces sp. NBC_01221]MCX4792493.1 HK97 gp10 family phage protein [Streptomyces sp. NBC_01221]